MRPQETRGVHVAPDAEQEHAASCAAERSGTLAEAEAATRAQARRESSRRGARRSCYPLVHHGTRQARGQRAAWRRSAAQKAATLAHVRSVLRKRAAARAAWRDTRFAGRAQHASGRERRAPEGFSTRGKQREREREKNSMPSRNRGFQPVITSSNASAPSAAVPALLHVKTRWARSREPGRASGSVRTRNEAAAARRERGAPPAARTLDAASPRQRRAAGCLQDCRRVALVWRREGWASAGQAPPGWPPAA